MQEQLKHYGNEDTIFNINSTATFLEHWQRYCRHNNLPKTTLYELRHTFVSATKTLPDGMIKSLIGHSKNMDTFGVYGHDFNGESTTTAVAVNNVFKNIIK